MVLDSGKHHSSEWLSQNFKSTLGENLVQQWENLLLHVELRVFWRASNERTEDLVMHGVWRSIL